MLDSGREIEAISQLEAAVVDEPTSASIQVLLARAYERVGRLNLAARSWSTALFLAPESPTARSGVKRLRDAHPDLQPEPPPPGFRSPEPDVPEAEEYHEQDPYFEADDAEVRINDPWPMEATEPETAADAASPASTEADTDENLDRLIRELETARIVPNPDFEAVPLDYVEDEDEGLVSETLARIYAAQQQYQEAAQVYEVLAEQQPDRAEEFRTRAEEMKMRGRA